MVSFNQRETKARREQQIKLKKKKEAFTKSTKIPNQTFWFRSLFIQNTLNVSLSLSLSLYLSLFPLSCLNTLSPLNQKKIVK